MSAWILIIIVQGWQAGVGSTGNAVYAAEFSTEEKCKAAVEFVYKSGAQRPVGDTIQAKCFPK